MTTETRIEEYLRSQGITQPARSFVSLVSNLYHESEAQYYDQVHHEIFETTDRWAECLKKIGPALPASVRVLDLGAGTGYAAEQVLQGLGGQVSQVVCQDLSPDMMLQCRARIGRLTQNAYFVAGELECLLGAVDERGFDLVVTNAVLHHLIDLPAFFNIIRRIVRPGGFYIAGHEPSDAFYANRGLYRWTEMYRKWRRLRRLMTPEPYLRRLKRTTEGKSLEQLTNEALLRKGVIKAPLPSGVIPHLVDIHIPPATPDVPFWGEPGFSAEGLQKKFLPEFELYSVLTYPHIKEARARMGPLWRAIDKKLAQKYPVSGANFLMVARRGQ